MPQAVANRYARALVDAVLAPTSGLDPQQAAAELRTVEEMLSGSAELRNVLVSPAVPAARKRAVMCRFAETLPVSKLVRNLLYVLIDRRRIGLLSEVRQAFELLLDERLGIVRADVRSARTLEDDQKKRLEDELSRVTGKQVRASFTVDEGLLGGVMARIGSTIYDGSVRAQLDAMREQLVSR